MQLYGNMTEIIFKIKLCKKKNIGTPIYIFTVYK